MFRTFTLIKILPSVSGDCSVIAVTVDLNYAFPFYARVNASSASISEFRCYRMSTVATVLQHRQI